MPPDFAVPFWAFDAGAPVAEEESDPDAPDADFVPDDDPDASVTDVPGMAMGSPSVAVAAARAESIAAAFAAEAF